MHLSVPLGLGWGQSSAQKALVFLSDMRAAVGFCLLSLLHHLLVQIASVSIFEEWRGAFETVGTA